MVTTRIGASSVQVVHQGAHQGAHRVSNMTLQAALSQHVDKIRVGGGTAQVVLSGADGGAHRAAAGGVDVVYTLGVQDAPRQRAWTFDMDGHTFYVLDLGERGAFAYDRTTSQWSHFNTVGYGGHWNMKNGFHWRGGKQVVGGAIQTGQVFRLVPDTWLDDDWRPVIYEVRGALFATDVATHRQYALRLIGSSGRLTSDESPKLNMQFSDDNGATWSHEFEITLTIDTRQRIEWRSLGSFSAPGRLFRLYDTGGVKFIAYVAAEIEGES